MAKGKPRSNAERRERHTKKYGAKTPLPARKGRNRK
jgi:hypothetical protein